MLTPLERLREQLLAKEKRYECFIKDTATFNETQRDAFKTHNRELHEIIVNYVEPMIEEQSHE